MFRSEIAQGINPPLGKAVPGRRQHKIKINQFNTLKDEQMMVSKMFQNNKKTLPEIQSPFLKRTLYSLFPSQHQLQLSPPKRYHQLEYNRNGFQGDLDRYMLKPGRTTSQKEALPISSKLQGNIGKSYSESKKPMTHLQELSGQIVIARRQPQKKLVKVPTQGSTSSTSKQIYEKLTNLNHKSKLAKQQIGLNLGGQRELREYRESHFVIKHKIAQSLYNQQKSQIKLVKDCLDGRMGRLEKSIKIKNYTKFFDNINVINIEN